MIVWFWRVKTLAITIVIVQTLWKCDIPKLTFQKSVFLKILDFEGSFFGSPLYSGDLKSGNNWNPDLFKIGFQMVQFSKSHAVAIAMVPSIWKLDHLKSRLFFQISNDLPFVQISNSLTQLDFRSHSKSEPFAN